MSENHKAIKYDKSRWKRGEWDNEPDRVDFIHAGYSCFIQRNMLGAWCGYVGVPKEHPEYEKAPDEVKVDVHGGLTYADKCNGHICHIPQPGMPDDVWWLGFDTAHSHDLIPFGEHYFDWATYKNMAYARAETESLAMQLAELVRHPEVK